MDKLSNWGKIAAVLFVFSAFAVLSSCGGVGGSITGSGGNGDWYYHWSCNGDYECLATNPTGQASGTLDEGPRQQSCLDVMQFGQRFWGSAATYSCDQNPSGTSSGGGNGGSASITSFSPAFAEPGQTITITGTNFPTSTSQVSVTIDNATMPVTAATSTSLTVLVPYIPNFTGPIVVSTGGGNASSSTSLKLVNPLYSVTYGNSTYVAVGGSGTILTSTNGTLWNQSTANTAGYYLDAVTWSGAEFIAVGGNGNILTSTDGVTWTNQTSNTTTSFYGVACSSTVCVAVGKGGALFASTNGISWSPGTSGTSNDLNAITWSGSIFVGVGVNGTSITSSNGTTWKPGGTNNVTNVFYGVNWSGAKSLFVAAEGNNMNTGGTLHTSTDGLNWTARTISGTTNVLYDTTSSGTTFVGVGSYGTIVTSADGVTWKALSSAPGGQYYLYGTVWANSQFVAVGDDSTILVSSDGANWTNPFGGSNL